MAASTRSRSSAKPWSAGAFYRAVWRWHFYAGIVLAPFALFLAVTGGLYLWKPQYEAWRYSHLLKVPQEARQISADAQFAAAVVREPYAKAVAFTPSHSPEQTSETIFRGENGDRLSVFVNPHDGAIVGTRRESERFMNTVRELHGKLLAGKSGQLVIELAASWMLVLLLTGFYLWWPRPRFRFRGFLVPRLRGNRRIFWRDLHAVPAVWFSVGAIFQLATAMPWTRVGGAWFRTIEAAAGERFPKEAVASTHHSEIFGWTPPPKVDANGRVDSLAGASPQDYGFGSTADGKLPAGTVVPPQISLDRVVAIAGQHGMHASYSIFLPAGPTDVISVVSDREVAFGRTNLHLDQYIGRVLADVRYGDYGFFEQAFILSLVGHEGQLFGLASQIFGTFACVGIFLMAASGLALWWRRRPSSKAAEQVVAPTLPRPVFVGIFAIAIFLPLLAGTLGVLFLMDFTVSSCGPWLRTKSLAIAGGG